MRSLILIAATGCLYAAPALRLTNSVVGPLHVAAGGSLPAQTLFAYNVGDGSLSLSVSVPPSVKWLSAAVGSPQACDPTDAPPCLPLRFTTNTATLAAGTYTAEATVSDPYAIDAPQVVIVTVQVDGPPSPPQSIDVYLAPGGTAEFKLPQQGISMCPPGCPSAAINTQDGGQWLTASIVTDLAGTIILSWHWDIRLAPPAGMAPGTYTASVFPSNSKAQGSIPVTMRLTDKPLATPSTNRISLRMAQGGPPSSYPFLPSITLQSTGMDAPVVKSAAAAGAGITASVSSDAVFLTVDPGSRSPGTYTDGRITIDCDRANCPIDVPVTLEIVPRSRPAIRYQSVVNGATFSPYEPAAPGEVMVLEGEQLSLNPPVFASSAPLPIILGGVSVLVDGTAAPLYYTSAGQVAFQLPTGTRPGTALVQVQCEGQTGNTVSLKVVPRAPQILSITDTAYNPRDAKHAARAGESLIIWTIGMGPTTPAVPAGVPAPANPPAVIAVAPLVLFGAGTVTPSFAGLAPGQIGLYQVNFTVPANSPKGVVSVKCGFRFDYFSDSVSLAIQ